jgi:hypothetical protein
MANYFLKPALIKCLWVRTDKYVEVKADLQFCFQISGKTLYFEVILTSTQFQCLEAVELGIPMRGDVQLKFIGQEREASLIECPVSYAGEISFPFARHFTKRSRNSRLQKEMT